MAPHPSRTRRSSFARPLAAALRLYLLFFYLVAPLHGLFHAADPACPSGDSTAWERIHAAGDGLDDHCVVCETASLAALPADAGVADPPDASFTLALFTAPGVADAAPALLPPTRGPPASILFV